MSKPKPKPIVVQARIEKGELKVPSRQMLLSALKHWPDGPVDLEVRPYEERRRLRANNFYWLAIGKVVAHERAEGIGQGWDKDDWHLYLAREFNGKVLSDLDPETGEVTEIRVGLSTAKLTIEAFGVYLESCLNLFAERYGLVIEPTPAEDWRTTRKGRKAA